MKRIAQRVIESVNAPVDPVKFEQAVFELFVSVPAFGFGLFLAVQVMLGKF